jgi:guanylate kinase
VGKTSIVRPLLDTRPDLVFSISCTTRPPRPGEVDGRDYRFVSPATFRELVEDGAFLEWAEVFGHRYGTLIAPIADALADGRNVLLEIDVQGARSVRSRFPDAVLIFIVPPSSSNFLQQLDDRLRRRGTESEAEIERRLSAAREEMEEASWFDRVVVNDQVERAAAEVAAIIDRQGNA